MKLVLDDIYFGKMNNYNLNSEGIKENDYQIWFLKVDKGEFTIGKHSNTTPKSG